VKPITKAEMIDFFKQYISPSSPARSKLSIHLHARSVSGDSSPAEATVSDLLATGVNMINLGSNITNGNHADASKSEPYLVEDVEAFKAKLSVAPAPKPVKDLIEFEDLDSML
jgi:insulysin